MKLRREDSVVVLSGRDKGKSGKVQAILPKTGEIVVENVAQVKRHTKPTQSSRGGIIEKPLPIPAGKVALICPHCKKPTRVGYGFKGETKQRVCRKCKKVIS